MDPLFRDPQGAASLATLPGEVVAARSLHRDDRWLLTVRFELSFQRRHALAEEALLLAVGAPLSARDLNATRAARRDEPDTVDADLLLVWDPDLASLTRRLADLPAAIDQLVALAPGVDLDAALGVVSPDLDLFDRRVPVHGNQLVGRDREIRRLEARVGAGESMAVVGMRKVGKTSLVRAAARRLRRGGVDVLWLDLQGVARDVSAIADALCDQLDAARGGLPALREALGKRLSNPEVRIAAVLDEFDLLFDGPEGAPAIPGAAELLGLLRGLHQQQQGRVASVFIGRDPTRLDRPTLEGCANPLLGWTAPLWVGPLEREACEELLRTLGRRHRLDPSRIDAVHARAYRWSGGHALLHRQVGRALLDEPGATAAEIVQAAASYQVAETIITEARVLLDHIAPGAHQILSDVAAGHGAPRSDHETRLLVHLGVLRGAAGAEWVPGAFAPPVPVGWVPR